VKATALRQAAAIPLALTAGLMLVSDSQGALSYQDTECQFRLGFKTLHDLIPEIVGECREDERYDPDNGDALQGTTRGLLVWRRADNLMSFTDGITTWVNGPFGLQSRASDTRFSWEPEESNPAPQPTPVSPPLALPPGADAPVRQAVTDAARLTGVDPTAVTVTQVEAHEWPDASLGCRGSGGFFAQVITPGFLVVLEAGGRRLEYHTDLGTQVVTC
jgi:hypothetical protein